jgi:hypothetical protein
VKIPQRKTKCPNCAEAIYVKTSPIDRERRLVTWAQAERFERQWSEYHEHQRWRVILESFGLTNEVFLQAQMALASPPSRPREAARFLLQDLAGSDINAHARKRAYYHLALLLEEAGEDYMVCLHEAARHSLLHHQNMGATTVEILTAGEDNACSACMNQHGRAFTIAEALSSMPLPCRDCTQRLVGESTGFCRCEYIPSR